jgi:hypothetical protein
MYGQSKSFRLTCSEPFMPLLSVRRAAVCFCLGLFLAIPTFAFAQTNYYTAEGTQYAIAGSLPGDQIFPDVALNNNGGYIVWQDNITDGSGWGISAMKLTSTLSGSGDVFRVNVNGTNDQVHAHVALLKNGGAAFVWQGAPKNVNHIYARFLNSSSLWLNSTDVLVSAYTNSSSFQINPAVATLSNGNVIVVWSSYDQAGSSSMMDVYGQMLSTNGSRIGTNFLVNQFTQYNQRNPTVAALNNGGFVVAWVSEQETAVSPDWGNNTTVSNTPSALMSMAQPSVDIYARIYGVSGSNAVASTSEFLVDTGNNPCSSPAVAAASDSSYMVTWCAKNLNNPSSDWDIYERSFTNGNGGLVNLVNSYTFGDQYNPRISSIGGDYLILFTSLGQDGSREGVYGQYVHEGDSLVGNEFLVNTTTLGQQMQPAVASDGVGQFLTIWTSFTFTANDFDLFAQRYANTSALLEPMAAPCVWAPFDLNSSGVYQPTLVVSWPPVQGLSISNYQVYVDGGFPYMAAVTSNQWTMTASNNLAVNSTHSFALEYETTAGNLSPMSPSATGTTWSGEYVGTAADPIPVEWMTEYFGGNPTNWPSAGAPVSAGGPTLWQIFESGGNPNNQATWLNTTLTKTSQGMFLSWNTQPGLTYQVQVTADFKTWSNLGAPRYESGTSDSIYLGAGASGYYRIQLLRQ